VSAEREARRRRADVLTAIAIAASRNDAAVALATVLDIELALADELLDLPLYRFITSRSDARS